METGKIEVAYDAVIKLMIDDIFNLKIDIFRLKAEMADLRKAQPPTRE